MAPNDVVLPTGDTEAIVYGDRPQPEFEGTWSDAKTYVESMSAVRVDLYVQTFDGRELIYENGEWSEA